MDIWYQRHQRQRYFLRPRPRAAAMKTVTMRFFGKLITRLKGPAAPASSDFAIAIDTLAAHVLAQHRLLGLLMGHVLALTPPEHRRNLVNLLYSGISHSDGSADHGLHG